MLTRIKPCPLNIPITQPKNEQSQCRICLESQDRDLLITPCKCNGSMKYVHEQCLKLWILSSNPDINSSSCELCKQAFIIEFELSRKCSFENFTNECFNIFIFPLVIIIISIVFAIALFYLVRGIRQRTLGDEEKVYFSLIVFACTILITTLVCVLVKTVGKACCVMKMEKWNIKSLNFKELDETFEVYPTEVNICTNGNALDGEVRDEAKLGGPRTEVWVNEEQDAVPWASQAVGRGERERTGFSWQQGLGSKGSPVIRGDVGVDNAARSFSVGRGEE